MVKIIRHTEECAVLLEEKTIVDRRTGKPRTIHTPIETVCASREVVNAWILGKQSNESEKK